MDAEITYDDGTRLRLSDIGVTVRDFVISSISLRTHYDEVEIRSGRVDKGASYGERTITVPFLFKASDLHDVALARDELLGVVNRRESFYIRELRRIKEHPGLICENDDAEDYEDSYVKGVQFRVRISGSYDVE